MKKKTEPIAIVKKGIRRSSKMMPDPKFEIGMFSFGVNDLQSLKSEKKDDELIRIASINEIKRKSPLSKRSVNDFTGSLQDGVTTTIKD